MKCYSTSAKTRLRRRGFITEQDILAVQVSLLLGILHIGVCRIRAKMVGCYIISTKRIFLRGGSYRNKGRIIKRHMKRQRNAPYLQKSKSLSRVWSSPIILSYPFGLKIKTLFIRTIHI